MTVALLARVLKTKRYNVVWSWVAARDLIEPGVNHPLGAPIKIMYVYVLANQIIGNKKSRCESS